MAVASMPFRRRTLILLIAVGVASLVVALVLSIFADDFQDHPTADANGYSRSAIGYKALVEILQRSGVPVMLSQHDSADRAKDGLLVVFAPDLDPDHASEELDRAIAGAPRVLLVLPRWWGPADSGNKSWITERDEVPAEDANDVLAAAGVVGTVQRLEDPIRGSSELPAIAPPTQVVADSKLVAELYAGNSGDVLLGSTTVHGATIWVLADPSPIDNAGLRHQGNATFAVDLINRLRDDGPVVFDETSHGYDDTPSLWRALFRFPLVLVTLHVLLGALVIGWAAIGRWGPPRGEPPPTRSGKDFLIRNTAELLHVGGHDGDALRRYLATTMLGVKRDLHAPVDLDAAGLRGWLERVRAERGGTQSIVELERDVNDAAAAKRSRAKARRIVELAARIHRWRNEMTHGPKHHP